jgi:hypothetical protein
MLATGRGHAIRTSAAAYAQGDARRYAVLSTWALPGNRSAVSAHCRALSHRTAAHSGDADGGRASGLDGGSILAARCPHLEEFVCSADPESSS